MPQELDDRLSGREQHTDENSPPKLSIQTAKVMPYVSQYIWLCVGVPRARWVIPNARLFTPVFKLSSARKMRCEAGALQGIISAIPSLSLSLFLDMSTHK